MKKIFVECTYECRLQARFTQGFFFFFPFFCLQGWFLGETLLLNGNFIEVEGGALVASGTVTLLEMNMEFVRRLFEVDYVSQSSPFVIL